VAQVGVLDFVKRQTKDSKHDYFQGTWDELVELVTKYWELHYVSSNNPGVLIVPMPKNVLHSFFSSTVTVTEDTNLKAIFSPRVPGETAFIQTTAMNALKKTAQHVEIILYSHETLAADGDAPKPRQADYYIVSINAYPTKEPSPMSPMTMARNFLGLKGGTRPPVPYTAEDFARSIIYWGEHVHTNS
jgi:hypothetical protein